MNILIGDALSVLQKIEDDFFDCVVTSPPYWGLRCYGINGQIGQEPTMVKYISALSTVFLEVKRVLKPTGTLFLNIGDSYARSGGTTDKTSLTRKRKLAHMSGTQKRMSKLSDGLKDKDLCMVPNRLAIKLQDDGWWVRSEIIWNKPNPLPYSGTDRPTSAHEKIWLLTKNKRYFWDKDAVLEPTGAQIRNVWTIPVVPYAGDHEAVFPIKLAERCIALGCPVGGHVLDPFGGHGTTSIAAKNLGRDSTIVEINPTYAQEAKIRIESSTKYEADEFFSF